MTGELLVRTGVNMLLYVRVTSSFYIDSDTHPHLTPVCHALTLIHHGEDPKSID